jgi:hypothetical protein
MGDMGMVDYSTLSDDSVRAAIRVLLDKMRGDKADLIGEVVKRWLRLSLREVEERKEQVIEAVEEEVLKPTVFPVSLVDESEKIGVMFLGYAKNASDAYKFARLARENEWMIEKWGKKEGKRRIRQMWVNQMRIEEIEQELKARRRNGPSRS